MRASTGSTATAWHCSAIRPAPTTRRWWPWIRTYLERAAVAPEVLAGVVGFAGPYAFNPLEFQETREIFAPSSHDPQRVQPLRLIRPRAAPPMLLAHGGADRRVLPINSVRFAAAMRAAGNMVDLRLYRRHGHVGLLLALANPFPRRSSILDDIVGFLDQMLPASVMSADRLP